MNRLTHISTCIRTLIVVLLMLICQVHTAKAETIVVGTVYDAHTMLPLQNVSVYFRATDVGCATNDEGLFMLRTDTDKKLTLVVSAIGYKTQKFTIEPNQYAGIEVELEEKSTMLQDVFVLPGANPALPIMARARNMRDANNAIMDLSDDVPLTSVQLYISDIERKHLQRKLWKSLQQGMIEQEDSSYLLPLYSCTSKGTQKEEHAALLTETDYSLLLNSISDEVNFYANNISVFGKSFLSPFASSGNSYYNYYLVDSIPCDSILNTGKAYLLHFKSKNPFFATFNGEMVLDSATCALRSINVNVPSEANVNFLNSLHINQTFYPNGTLQNEDLSIIFDFAVKADSSHIFPSVTAIRKVYASPVSTPVDMVPMLSHAPLMISSTTADTTDVENLSLPVNETETDLPDYALLPIDTISPIIDSLNNLPVMKVARFASYFLNTGYFPTRSVIDIGIFNELIQFNPQEKLHLGLPLRTNAKLWPHLCLEAYAGYGFHDHAWKGKGQIQYQLPTPRRHIIGAYYWDHYTFPDITILNQMTRENGIGYSLFGFTNALIQNFYTNDNAYNTLTRVREFHIWTENDWTDNIETRFDVKIGRTGYGDSMVGYDKISSFQTRSIAGLVRIGFDERKIDLFFKRIHVYSQHPVVVFRAEFGSYSTESMTQDNLYGRLDLMVRQQISLGMGGQLSYLGEAGIILGKVPYPLLTTFLGNQTYGYDPYRFTLMNNAQFIADKYIWMQVTWDGQGVLFNRIPGIRYLRLHELLECKVAYGGLSDKHNSIMPLPDRVSNLTVPYVEVGIGIGNIFRVLDLYSVWRVTNRSDLSTPLWGMRFMFNLGM